jgi:hypothetical protein
MPLNLAESIRIRRDQQDEFGVHYYPSDDTFDLSIPFVIERETADGYEMVEYTLSSPPGLVAGARQVVLSDPSPGHYIVSWEGSTCAEPQSQTGSGRLIGDFTLTEEVVYPTELGVLEIQWMGTHEQEFNLGIDASCEAITTTAIVGVAEITLEFPDEWLPWADAADIALIVDDEIVRGYGDVDSQAAANGRYSTSITTICSASDPDALANYDFGPAPGPHRVKLSARVEGHGEVVSQDVEYEVDCDDDSTPGGPIPGDRDDSDTRSGGCSIADLSGRNVTRVAAFLMPVFLRRRNALRR